MEALNESFERMEDDREKLKEAGAMMKGTIADSGLVAAYDHPIHGAGLRHGAMSHWPLSERRLQGPCQSGDATVMLLRELGKTPEQVRTLRNSGVVKNAAEALS